MFKIGIIQSSRGIPPPPPPPPAADYTPNPVNWETVIHEIDPDIPPTLGDYFFYSIQQITGITNTINLEFFYDPAVVYRGQRYLDVFNLYYALTDFDPVSWNFDTAPNNYGFNYYPPIADLVTILPNYYFSFGVLAGSGWSTLKNQLSGTDWSFVTPVVVINKSDDNTQLDVFNMIVRFRGSTREPLNAETGEEVALNP